MSLPPTGPVIPGITEEASYEKNLPSVDRALQAPKDPTTPEEESRRKASALFALAKTWFDAHAWYYRECVENEAMVNGAQYGYYSTWESRWIPVPEVRNPYEIRLVINLEKPIVDQATAILTQEQPQFECAPGATEIRDKAASETATELTRYIWDYHFLDQKFRTTARSAFVAGMSFVLAEWDRTAGPLTVSGFQGGDPTVDEAGNPTVSPLVPSFTKQGDHRFTILQRDQVAYDPASRAIDGTDGVGVMVRQKIATTRLIEMYPNYKPSSADRNGTEGEAMREDRVERYTPYQPAWGVKQGTSDPAADEQTVFTFWMRSREPDYPMGKVFVFTADGQMLDERDNEVYPTWQELQAGEQWPNYHWPIFAIYCDTRENSPLGRGRVLDMHHAQKAANGTFSKAVQHSAIIANAKVFMPKGLDVEWTDEMGQVIRYGRMYQPNSVGYVQPPMMPPEYLQIVQAARDIMENIAGINAATMGGAPSNDPSGRLSESLQQRDYVRLDFIKTEMYRKWALVMKYALRLFRRNATTERRLLVTGANGETAMKFFDASSLAAGTDVLVFNNTMIPKDPSKRMLWLMNFITTLSQAPDENTRILLMKLADKREFISILQDANPHKIRAERMIRQAILGARPMPQPWDNPLTFKTIFEQYLCEEEFEKAAAADPTLAQWAEQMWTYYTEQAAPQPAPGMVPGGDPTQPQGLTMTGAEPQGAPPAAPPA